MQPATATMLLETWIVWECLVMHGISLGIMANYFTDGEFE